MTEDRLQMLCNEARLTSVICLVTPETINIGFFKERN